MSIGQMGNSANGSALLVGYGKRDRIINQVKNGIPIRNRIKAREIIFDPYLFKKRVKWVQTYIPEKKVTAGSRGKKQQPRWG